MKNMTEWKTSELVEFLNSYNRVYKTNQTETIPYKDMYVQVFAELFNRSPLMALIY